MVMHACHPKLRRQENRHDFQSSLSYKVILGLTKGKLCVAT